MMKPSELATIFGTAIAETTAARHEALEVAAVIIEGEAKAVIGTYKYGWTELADSTKRDRERKGFPPNEPLLRTGELRDSIEHSAGVETAYVGSNLNIAVYQELGTSRIPPRSFLMGAAVHKGKEAAIAAGAILFRPLLQRP
jgi:phage gpG-like protein